MLQAAGALLVLLACTGPAWAQQVTSEILVHTTLTAGLAHHEAKQVWDSMRVGDAIALVREPGNAHDPNAVRVEWHSHMLGYLPREDNETIARQIDRGNRLSGRIVRLDRYRNHRMRLGIDIYLALQPAAR